MYLINNANQQIDIMFTNIFKIAHYFRCELKESRKIFKAYPRNPKHWNPLSISTIHHLRI